MKFKVLKTDSYSLQLNMGNELFLTKTWYLSGLRSAFSTLKQKICQLGLIAWTLYYLPFPWGLLWISCFTQEWKWVSPINLLAPGMSNSGGSFPFHRNSGGITKSSPKGRSLNINVCKQWRTIRMPLTKQCLSCRYKTQTLFGLIKCPSPKRKWCWSGESEPKRFWDAVVCASPEKGKL